VGANDEDLVELPPAEDPVRQAAFDPPGPIPEREVVWLTLPRPDFRQHFSAGPVLTWFYWADTLTATSMRLMMPIPSSDSEAMEPRRIDATRAVSARHRRAP
jgi:hypothetical protein